jgi:phenylalanyl-tRNA synthetase alpha subunit
MHKRTRTPKDDTSDASLKYAANILQIDQTVSFMNDIGLLFSKLRAGAFRAKELKRSESNREELSSPHQHPQHSSIKTSYSIYSNKIGKTKIVVYNGMHTCI